MKKIVVIILILVTNSLFCQMPNTITKADKIYGLSKFWQEVNYNFAFLYKIDKEKWDAEYRKLITEVQETENDYEYYRLLNKFCALLNDGHTNIFYPKDISEKIYYSQFGEYRIFLSNIEGKAIITKINLSKKDEIPIGSEVVKVNGLTTKEYVNKYRMPYISSSTDHIRDHISIIGLFKAPKGTSFEVQLKLPQGEIKNLTLIHSETKETEVFPDIEEQVMEFKWMSNETAYIAMNSFDRDSKMDSLFIDKLPELYKAKKLIIDLRDNLGGSTSVGFDIMQYLTLDNFLYGLKLNCRVHMPAYKAWGAWTEAKDTIGNADATKEYLSYRDNYFEEIPMQLGEIKIKNKKRIVVPTAILIGNFTASAAEDFLLFSDNQKHMTKIGEPTFGSTGQPLTFKLPGGGSARVCTLNNTYTDGREFIGIGILPDIKVSKSLKDYMENKDPVLEKAIEYLNN